MTRGILALVAIVAIVAGVILMGKSPASGNGKESGSDPAIVPEQGSVAGNPTASGAVFPVKIVMECESPTEILKEDDLIVDNSKDLVLKSKNGTILMQVKQHSEGQLVRYLEIPDGWIEACYKEHKGKPGDVPGKLSYVFEAPRDDTYYVNLRAKWMDSCGNSVWVKIDDGEWLNLEDENGKMGEKNYKWAWHPLFVGGKAKAFQLKQGKHALWLNTREDGPCLDQWLVSTEASVPVGGAMTSSR